MNNLTSMHIKSSPAHIRLERKMTSIIWQKDFSVIVSFSCGQISSFDSRFDGTWILNEKQFKSKTYVFSWKVINSVKKLCGRVQIGFIAGILYYVKFRRLDIEWGLWWTQLKTYFRSWYSNLLGEMPET